MNKIRIWRKEAWEFTSEKALNIQFFIRDEINKINRDIKVDVSMCDISRITVYYLGYIFEFQYFYLEDGSLLLRGRGKKSKIAYIESDLERKTRAKAYKYIKGILAEILSKENV